jgi:hypothetical protein
MGDINPANPLPRKPVRAPSYTGVTAEPASAAESVVEAEPRVAISVGVADGFRFGCGMLLAGAVFYCGLVVVVAILVVVAALFGIPLPLGIGAH